LHNFKVSSSIADSTVMKICSTRSFPSKYLLQRGPNTDTQWRFQN